MQSSVADIVNRLKRNHDRSLGCVLLIGAGCSKSAGIPLAGGFVDIIQRDFEFEYIQAAAEGEADYPRCMGKLSPGDRRELMNGFLRESRINWAHIHIARLIKHGCVDRVLTTNFDPLLVRACALFNIFPAVYDMAAMKGFEPQRIDGPAIFHLHGTGSGFFQAHDTAEVQALTEKLEPLFQDCRAKQRTWIVAGYSARCDPVVEHLMLVNTFDQHLYWALHPDKQPSAEIQNLFRKDNAAYWLAANNADSFFQDLADGVGCPAPPFLDKPFSHLETVLRDIKGFRKEDGEKLASYANDALDRIRRAQHCIEPHRQWACNPGGPAPDSPSSLSAPTSLVEQLEMRIMAEDWDGVVAQRELILKDGSDAARKCLAWAYAMQGSDFDDQAQTLTGTEADALWRQADDKYQQAIATKPDMHEAFNNWGSALGERAKNNTGDEADTLLRQACDKFQQAIAIKPDLHEALYNWGIALAAWARTKTGDEADALRQQACDKFQQATTFKPDGQEAFNNWGIALDARAKTKSGAEADALWRQACDKYQQANAIMPGHSSFNLACITALRGQPEGECRRWLEDSRDHGQLPSRAHMESDTDLDSVRHLPWFQEILNAAK